MKKDHIKEILDRYPDKKPVAFLQISAGFAGQDTGILIFDEPQDNLYAEEFRIFDPDPRTEAGLMTVPYKDVQAVRKLAEDPVFDLEKEGTGYVEEAGFIVNDGADQELVIFRGRRMKIFRYSNLDFYKKYLNDYPQTKAALKLMDKMIRTVRKNTALEL